MSDQSGRVSSSYVRLPDTTVWPDPNDPGEVQWLLRNGDAQRSDLLLAASAMAAYRELIWMPDSRRREVIRALRDSVFEQAGVPLQEPRRRSLRRRHHQVATDGQVRTGHPEGRRRLALAQHPPRRPRHGRDQVDCCRSSPDKRVRRVSADTVPSMTLDDKTARELSRAAKNVTTWTEKRNALIRDALTAGAGVREVARATDLAPATVLNIQQPKKRGKP